MSNAQRYLDRMERAREHRQMVAELEAERDRLREALEKMLDPEKAGVVTYEIGVMQDIARAAIAKVRGTNE